MENMAISAVLSHFHLTTIQQRVNVVVPYQRLAVTCGVRRSLGGLQNKFWDNGWFLV